jgi:probable phosphoglycerate mutase
VAVELLWARHAQSEANVARRLSHEVYDPPLTALGRTQADVLAARLCLSARDFVSGPVFCSPMVRARETADRVAALLGHPVVPVDELRELDVGAIDGRSDAAAWALHDATLDAWERGEHDVAFPSGEDQHGLAERVRSGLARVVALSDGPRVLVVAHGGNLRAMLPMLDPRCPPLGRTVPNVGVARLRVADDGSCRLLEWPAPAVAR